jgi:hypothetical protein
LEEKAHTNFFGQLVAAGGASQVVADAARIEMQNGRLEYPELELSTNLAENSMRPVALGRKNWIHIASPLAGPKAAAIFSVVESCRRLKGRSVTIFPRFCPGFRSPDPVPPRPYSRCVGGRHSWTQATEVELKMFLRGSKVLYILLRSQI